jgi:hypothetical protein
MDGLDWVERIWISVGAVGFLRLIIATVSLVVM